MLSKSNLSVHTTFEISLKEVSATTFYLKKEKLTVCSIFKINGILIMIENAKLNFEAAN